MGCVMKKRGLLVIVFMAIIAFALTGCKGAANYEKYTKIVFELEGGSYMNCTLPVVQYYDFKNETGNKIKEMEKFSKGEFGYTGYEFIGWFKTKNADGTYSDPFDFENDTVTKEGITLYASWEREKNYSYQVVYIDEETSDEVVLGTYKVQEGDAFNDFSHYDRKRTGYTSIGYFNEDGTPYDTTYKHEGESNPVKKVYVKYIKGSYVLVSTKEELVKANGQNIYLLNDIDLKGAEFQFGTYVKKEIQGNGYSIKNFKVTKDSYGGGKNDVVEDVEDPSIKALYISLFKMLKDSTVNNIKFENVSVEINTTYKSIGKIYVAPIVVLSSGNKITDVEFSGTYKKVNLPTGLDEENLIIASGAACTTDGTTLDGSSFLFNETLND